MNHSAGTLSLVDIDGGKKEDGLNSLNSTRVLAIQQFAQFISLRLCPLVPHIPTPSGAMLLSPSRVNSASETTHIHGGSDKFITSWIHVRRLGICYFLIPSTLRQRPTRPIADGSM